MAFCYDTFTGDRESTPASNETYQPGMSYMPVYSSELDELGFFKSCQPLEDIYTEYQDIKKLNFIIDYGWKEIINPIYSKRSISKALPKPEDVDKSKQKEYSEECDKLSVELVGLLEKLFNFYQQASRDFSDIFRKTTEREIYGQSIAFQLNLALLGCMDVFLVMDCLKTSKSSFLNDISNLKRCCSASKDLRDINLIHSLATFYFFISNIKSIVERVQGCQEFLTTTLNLVLARISSEFYVSPREKHAYFRNICIILYFLEQDKTVAKLDQKGLISLSTIDETFKKCSVVPVIGDMIFNIFNFLKLIPSISNYEWTFQSPINTAQVMDLISFEEMASEKYFAYITQCLHCSSQFNRCKELYVEPNFAKHVYVVCKSGIQFLCLITSKLMEVFAYKLNLATNFQTQYMSEGEPKLSPYEISTLKCYTEREKVAFIRIIFYIRTIYNELSKFDCIYSLCIHTAIRSELQFMIKERLRTSLKKVLSSPKKSDLKLLLDVLLSVCLDVAYSGKPEELFSKPKKKTVKESTTLPMIASTYVSPSYLQIHIIRCILSKLIKESSLKKKLENEEITYINEFLMDSIFFTPLLAFSQSVKQVSDLSMFWFREMNLEYVNPDSDPFCVSHSFLYMLVKEASDHTEYISSNRIFYLLDLYNDSANFALYDLNVTHLYDEITVEANICFRQLCYLLCEQMHMYFRSIAACMILNKGVRASIIQKLRSKNISVDDHPLNLQSGRQYSSVLLQKSVKMLGKSVDIRTEFSIRFNRFIIDSLESAFLYYESDSDLTNIIELQVLLEITQMTHRLINSYIPLQSYNILYDFVNQPLPGTMFPRIVGIVIQELLINLFSKFSYCSSTQRFIPSFSQLPTDSSLSCNPDSNLQSTCIFDKGPIVNSKSAPDEFVASAKKKQRLKMRIMHSYGSRSIKSLFECYYKIFFGFIGIPHLQALVRVLGFSELSYLLKELNDFLVKMVEEQLTQSVNVLGTQLPVVHKVPHKAYTREAVMVYMASKYKNLFEFMQENPVIINGFKIFGNCLIFIFNIETILKSRECLDLVAGAELSGVTPAPIDSKHSDDPIDVQSAITRTQIFRDVNVMHQVSSMNLEDMQGLFLSDLVPICNEKLACGLSVFSAMADRIRESLTAHFWRTTGNTLGGSSDPNSLKKIEFQTIWSLLLYYISTHDQEVDLTPKYGDGVVWSGALLIMLLQHNYRFHLGDFVRHILECGEDIFVLITQHSPIKSLRSSVRRRTMSKATKDFKTLHKTRSVGSEEMNKQVCKNSLKLHRVHQITMMVMALCECSLLKSSHAKSFKRFDPPQFHPDFNIFDTRL